MTQEIVSLPITGWELRTVPTLDAMLITLSYLTNSLQSQEDAEVRTFAIHSAQARELAQRILSLCDQQEDSAPQGAGLPKH